MSSFQQGVGFPYELLGGREGGSSPGSLMAPPSREEVVRAVSSLPVSWRHPIEIHGVPVPAPAAAEHTRWMLRCMNLPDSMAGEAVLDVGCSDGFFSFEAEKRGASRVVGIDRWWGCGPAEGGKPFDGEDDADRTSVTSAPFFTAHRLLRSRVEFFPADIQRIEATPEVAGCRFTTIFFLGVFYHLENILGAFRNLRMLCAGRVFVEGTVHRSSDLPVMEFLGRPHDIQWRPTVACLVKMMQASGFSQVRHLGDEGDRVIFEIRP